MSCIFAASEGDDDMANKTRAECILFAKLNGLQIKADRQKIVTVYCPVSNWVDCFDSWTQAYQFLFDVVQERNHSGRNYPWIKN